MDVSRYNGPQTRGRARKVRHAEELLEAMDEEDDDLRASTRQVEEAKTGNDVEDVNPAEEKEGDDKDDDPTVIGGRLKGNKKDEDDDDDTKSVSSSDDESKSGKEKGGVSVKRVDLSSDEEEEDEDEKLMDKVMNANTADKTKHNYRLSLQRFIVHLYQNQWKTNTKYAECYKVLHKDLVADLKK